MYFSIHFSFCKDFFENFQKYFKMARGLRFHLFFHEKKKTNLSVGLLWSG